MPQGVLFIKSHTGITPVNGSLSNGWVDAFLQWGVSFSQSALSSLITPAPNKAYVENKSRLSHGKEVITDSQYVKKDERDLSLEMHITARPSVEGNVSYSAVQNFWRQYDRFCSEVLDYGYMELKISYVPNKVFRLTYENCNQFAEFNQRLAKFTLRVNEPNPNNRGV